MTYALHDLLVTDAALDAVAGRDSLSSDDLVLAGLAALAAAVDEASLPRPAVSLPIAVAAARPPMTTARKAGFALAATVALMVTSSGVAAAVTGDALAPLRYVAHQMQRIGPHGSSQVPGWDRDASGAVLQEHRSIGRAALMADVAGGASHVTGSGWSGAGGAGPTGHGPWQRASGPTAGGGREHAPQSGHGHQPGHSRPGQPVEDGPSAPAVPRKPTPPGTGLTAGLGDTGAGHTRVAGESPILLGSTPVTSAPPPVASAVPEPAASPLLQGSTPQPAPSTP